MCQRIVSTTHLDIHDVGENKYRHRVDDTAQQPEELRQVVDSGPNSTGHGYQPQTEDEAPSTELQAGRDAIEMVKIGLHIMQTKLWHNQQTARGTSSYHT